jgi:hypothetical protein
MHGEAVTQKRRGCSSSRYYRTTTNCCTQLLELLKWKAETSVTDSSFEKLLVLMKKMLPRKKELPASTYKAKKLVYPLGLDV